MDSVSTVSTFTPMRGAEATPGEVQGFAFVEKTSYKSHKRHVGVSLEALNSGGSATFHEDEGDLQDWLVFACTCDLR